MIQIGDIIMHTKNGNNNSYNKDDGTNYLNWEKAIRKDTFENRIMEYTRNLIKFRYENPIFTSTEFKKSLTFHYDIGKLADFNNENYWKNPLEPFVGVMINSSQRRIFIAISKNDNKQNVLLPQNLEQKSWHVCSDSSIFGYIDLQAKDYIEKSYILNPQALAIFIEK